MTDLVRVTRQVVRMGLNALISPAPRNQPGSFVRDLLSLRVIFDIASFLLQVRDLRRVLRINSEYMVEDSHTRAAHDYNAGRTLGKLITTTRRTEMIYRALQFPPQRDFRQEKLIIIGPRNVQELFIAWLHGFAWENIEAIDLFSTHPKINRMDMDAMSIPPETYDAVGMDNTLAYSKDPIALLAGIAKIMKPGGRFAFTHTHNPVATDFVGGHLTGEDVRAGLESAGLEVYMMAHRDKPNSHGDPVRAHTFGAYKPLNTTTESAVD